MRWFYGPGVKLDFRSFPDGHAVTAAEVESALRRINHDVRPGDVVLANTAAGGCYGSERCLSSGVGFGREATNWLTERGVRLVGTDAWSWDAPLSHTAEARPRRVRKVESGKKKVWKHLQAPLSVAAHCHAN